MIRCRFTLNSEGVSYCTFDLKKFGWLRLVHLIFFTFIEPNSSLPFRFRVEWQPPPERKCDVSGNSRSLMDLSSILIAFLMILSIGKSTVSDRV